MKFILLVCAFMFISKVQAKEIQILEGDNIEPYAIKGKDGLDPSGIQVDIFNAIFAGTPYKPKFVFVPLYRVSTNVDTFNADGATRMFHFDNKKIGGFLSKYPYIKYKGCVITLESSTNITLLSELSKLSIIGFQGASIDFSKEFNDAVKLSPKYKEMNNQSSQITLLYLNRVDAIVADFYISELKERLFVQKNHLQEKKLRCDIDLGSKPYYAFFKSEKVRDTFDIGLQKIIKNGTYDKIFKKYNVVNSLFIK